MLKFFPCLLLAFAALSGMPQSWADDQADEPAEAPAPFGGVTYDLEYRFTPGEVLRTEIVHRATVQTSIQGTSQTAETLSKSIKN
ncbi:MAG: hypothetical protein HY288_19010, partial [Planctomycetia bacterium]|nr:hypothetical protein [Planctomycetia bacterium]